MDRRPERVIPRAARRRGLSIAGAVAINLGVSALFLALAFRGVAPGAILVRLEHVALWPWVPLAVLSYLLGHFLRGLRSKRLVSGEATISTFEATNAVVAGYAANNVLPARLGELVRVGMLRDRSGLPLLQVLTVVFLERLLDGLALLLLLFISTRAAAVPDTLAPAWRIAVILLGVASVAALFLVIAPGGIVTTAAKLAAPLRPAARDAVVEAAMRLVNGAVYLRGLGRTMEVSALSLGVWLCEAGMFVALLPAVGLAAQPATGLAAMALTNLGILLPSTPGFIGTFHYFCQQSLIARDVSPDHALTYALVVHLTFYVPITLWGFAVVMVRGAGEARRLLTIRHAETEPPAGSGGAASQASVRASASEAASPFVRSLVASILPEHATDRHRLAMEHATTFVAAELADMPRRFRSLMAVGFVAFRIVTIATHGRDFSRLPIEAARRWLNRWMYGRLAAGRLLFRGVRSLAWLAYYEVAPLPDIPDMKDAR
jgi:uncharacterized protein (TIRG00374 family)